MSDCVYCWSLCRHHFLVSIDKGIKVYKAIELIGGKPTVVGWRTGKVVQRAHQVAERGGNIYVVSKWNESNLSFTCFNILT